MTTNADLIAKVRRLAEAEVPDMVLRRDSMLFAYRTFTPQLADALEERIAADVVRGLALADVREKLDAALADNAALRRIAQQFADRAIKSVSPETLGGIPGMWECMECECVQGGKWAECRHSDCLTCEAHSLLDKDHPGQAILDERRTLREMAGTAIKAHHGLLERNAKLERLRGDCEHDDTVRACSLCWDDVCAALDALDGHEGEASEAMGQ